MHTTSKPVFRTLAERRSSDFYGRSVGTSTVAPTPKVVVTAREQAWSKADKVYYSLTAHSLEERPLIRKNAFTWVVKP